VGVIVNVGVLVSVGVSVGVGVGVCVGQGVGVGVTVKVGVGVGVGVVVDVGLVVGVTVGVICSNGIHELSILSMVGNCLGVSMVVVPSAYWFINPLKPPRTLGLNGVNHGSPSEPFLVVMLPKFITSGC
jgi:hypothetical protein